MTKKNSSLQVFILTISIASMTSIFTLWLIEAPVKYPLFFLEVILILVLSFTLGGSTINFPKWGTIHRLRLAPQIFLIGFSILLLVWNIFASPLTQTGLEKLFVALPVIFLLGYAIMTLSGLSRYFSRLEIIVLSFVVGYASSGLLFFLFLPLEPPLRPIALSASFLSIGIPSIIKERLVPNAATSRSSFSRPGDIVVLGVVLTFYLVSFSFIYPNFALLPGTDLSRHYASSLALSRAPELYTGSVYLLHHLFLASILSLTDANIIIFQTSLLFFLLILPLAFYIMARKFLESIDSRLPSLSTLFFSFFTSGFGGFSWIYFAYLKGSSSSPQGVLLAQTAAKTYNGTINAVFGLWYVPTVVGFITLLALFFLLTCKDIPRFKYIPLFSLLILAGYLTHVTEVVVFVSFLGAYSVFSMNNKLRLNDGIRSAIIGILLAGGAYFTLSLLSVRFLGFTFLGLQFVIPLLALLGGLVFGRKRIVSILTNWGSRLARRSVITSIILGMFLLYLVSILTWTSSIDAFATSQVITSGIVPWFLYPLMLGLGGLFSLLSLVYLRNEKRLFFSISIFIAFTFFSLAAGRVVSFLNLNFFETGFWEKRFLRFIWISMSIMAPITAIRFSDRIAHAFQNQIAKKIAITLFAGIVVTYGASTTFLNIEYWSTQTDSTFLASAEEIAALNEFSEILSSDPTSWAASLTKKSTDFIKFSGPSDFLGLTQLLYTSNAHLALELLYRHPSYSHAYIYVHERDVENLQKYPDSYLSWLLGIMPIVFENSEVTIYNASHVSPVSTKSDTALMIPFDESLQGSEILLAYEMLSRGSYNYTVAFDIDNELMKAHTLILPFDLPSKPEATYQIEDFDPNEWTLISGAWNFENSTLMAGAPGRDEEGILLASIAPKTFQVNFKVKLIDANRAVANYASLIYSWMDSDNYRMIDILFHTDGYIYVHSRYFQDGVETVFPVWPGVNTGIAWEIGTEYDVDLSVDGNLVDIIVNNKTFLSIHEDNTAGRIGLRYFRSYSLAFHDFNLSGVRELTFRAYEDYLGFMNAGGKIILLNTDGAGRFSEDFFISAGSDFTADSIRGELGSIRLGGGVEVTPLQYLGSGGEVLQTYNSSISNLSTLYLFRTDYGEGEFYYVNVYPLIKALLTDEEKEVYQILGELLANVGLTRIQQGVLDPNAYVREVELNKNVVIEADSILFPINSFLGNLTINDEPTLMNVTKIMFTQNTPVSVKMPGATLLAGNSYSIVTSPGPVLFEFNKASVEGIANNEGFENKNVRTMSLISVRPIRFIVRMPSISAEDALFKEIYTFGSFHRATRAYGEDLLLKGGIKFIVTVSDSYTEIKDVEFGGSFSRLPPLSLYDELASFETAASWVLILLPIFAIAIFGVIWYRKASLTRARPEIPHESLRNGKK